MQSSRQGDQGIELAGSLLRLRQSIAVAFAVLELQRIIRADTIPDLTDRLGIEERPQTLAGADAHVMTALRADVEVALKFGAIEHRIARRAFDPQALRHRARAALGLDARGDDLFKP